MPGNWRSTALAQASSGSVAGVRASAPAISQERECSRSACEPYRQAILEKLELGLSAQRIYQDLVSEGFDHEYPSAAYGRNQSSQLSAVSRERLTRQTASPTVSTQQVPVQQLNANAA